jgi:hypothetical protein
MHIRKQFAYFVVNLLVQIFDENVALTSLTESGVTLGPHDTAGMTRESRQNVRQSVCVPSAVLNEGIVELLQSTLTFGLGLRISNICAVKQDTTHHQQH